MNSELLWAFIPTRADISLTLGTCITLAFTLRLS